ncbi:carbon-nitrogen hydrolase family protein [Erwiniaceae bacterium BAC15a-03b]|uniref:Carbon-nitrogen hydrolase family protein n=1 Tax=Winslowiella arboricola TaxID=2978220 RepID=A0A9J6PUS0_9GAMM|nr:carbon-nitrogen hydrolase family protein [Winslowiella arboricola]MCU5775877.1 carbon-nitrogen hydrolase family protein [Winslowiella arboricola]MCU5779272.1 carbon-nitrogen hydrolase family protein [Winslowiella arboricola]
MPNWNVAAAQYASRAGDIDANIAHHLTFIRQAATLEVDLIVFPQLSITGYELEVTPELAMLANDPRLQQFADAARDYDMTVIIGIPLRVDQSQHNAAMTFLPDGTRLTYAKRHLLDQEPRFFVPGAHGGPIFGAQQRNVGMAVCADISIEEFARDVADGGADLYVVTALLPQNIYHDNCAHLARWSSELKMSVLMSNHAIPTGGHLSDGGSAFWDAEGNQVIHAGSGEALMIARQNAGGWQGEIHPLG